MLWWVTAIMLRTRIFDAFNAPSWSHHRQFAYTPGKFKPWIAPGIRLSGLRFPAMQTIRLYSHQTFLLTKKFWLLIKPESGYMLMPRRIVANAHQLLSSAHLSYLQCPAYAQHLPCTPFCHRYRIRLSRPRHPRPACIHNRRHRMR